MTTTPPSTNGPGIGTPVATVAIPSQAVSVGQDILGPLETLLQGLHMWETPTATTDSTTGLTGTFRSPPASVALIESTATALSKWWASGLGASVIAIWAGIGAWWLKQDRQVQGTVIWAAGIATGAAILAIGYILGSDLRGRSAAAVATIAARARVTEIMVRATQASQAAPSPSVSGVAQSANTQVAATVQPPSLVGHMVALSPPVVVSWTARPALDETGWRALAMLFAPSAHQYFLVKDAVQEWVDAAEIVFPSP